jgi:hypothetical protein
MLKIIDAGDDTQPRNDRGQRPVMAKGGAGGGKGGRPRPVNGPSTTGNESGKNRGNNPSWK